MVEGNLERNPAWLNVSRETIERLEIFESLVRQWTQRINLVSPATVQEMWNRHILDSAQLYRLARPGSKWVDLGSGGGFPGIILAIIAQERDPGRTLHLVESDQRKAAFLRKAAIELQCPVEIHTQRAEVLTPMSADCVSARALAPLVDLLPLVSRHLIAGGRAVLPKGIRATEEIEKARAVWTFDLTIEQSQTDPQAKVLLIENLRHV
ncbi:16S rRNA (guanine(527)-N(7))-methyltransferase RsmG [Stagnihabitans tardus]|uniref:Ribosomal RNA small subunit methyltransferase G n=1 Tax=Stagnihabitans tardus TaxID=2699202 RepID=A0AAE4YBU2_9RHOB|nr:16S rRNA (guanine(527)-N(7))-methyltransferase RsmG [Stagnihabitans tardus]NBZ86790.1 16S rRNA (guanine(527)-N(7))-methyltransferase RsmG [Stagnihabitans tardus]